MYEIGKVYVWRKITDPGFEHISVIGPGIPAIFCGRPVVFWPTDTIDPYRVGRIFHALPGDLRPHDTPSGERSVMDLFEQVRA